MTDIPERLFMSAMDAVWPYDRPAEEWEALVNERRELVRAILTAVLPKHEEMVREKLLRNAALTARPGRY